VMDHDVSCVVADDHPILLHAMRTVLEANGIRVTGTATSGETAVELIVSDPPTVALVDLRLDGFDGIRVVQALHAAQSPTRVILFTGYGNGQHVREALKAGAYGFIQKDAPVTELLRAIRMVCDDQQYIDPTLSRQLVTSGTGRGSSLTRRESDVLSLVAAGQTTCSIATQLGLSEDAAQSSIQAVMRKLGAATRSQAVAMAVRHALIP
jgi:DNA-binding NarL/FixJ family response regulator